MKHSTPTFYSPALSKWLKELEEDVGLPLFERHARGLRPTSYGEALIEHARRIEARRIAYFPGAVFCFIER